MTAIAADAASEPQWFGQPRGLTILFLTEMWEKFSYYGMRALLVYYMTKQLMIPQAQSSLIYGGYTAFAYFTPLVGAVIADQWLGRRRAVIIGGAVMALGHFMMTYPPLFYPALATIALGNGLFLPSLPSQVNSLYPPRDPRRASAYNIYYAGINLGAFLSSIVCGWLGETFGWHWGFGAAGIGMLAGLVIYTWGGRYLPPQGMPARRGRAQNAAPPPAWEQGAGARIALLVAITVVVVLFRGAYEQSGNTVALWADEGIDRAIGAGRQIPMTWFQAINPLAVMVFTPFIVGRWTRLAKRGRESSSMVKMALGAAGVGVSFLLAAAITWWAAKAGVRAHWIWLVAFNLVLTVGELYILPVGLGLFGRLAPQRIAALTIAIWFAPIFVGNLLAGYLGTFWSRLTHAEFFAMIGAVAFASAALLLVFDRPARRMEAGAEADLAALHTEP
jgi:POT family proton-dependent oligopeptide transporter